MESTAHLPMNEEQRVLSKEYISHERGTTHGFKFTMVSVEVLTEQFWMDSVREVATRYWEAYIVVPPGHVWCHPIRPSVPIAEKNLRVTYWGREPLESWRTDVLDNLFPDALYVGTECMILGGNTDYTQIHNQLTRISHTMVMAPRTKVHRARLVYV